mgnify:CR=1 FL=1
MGDHRATIKISFDIHGKKHEQEWWINYSPDEITGVDPRIADWFSECWTEAKARYDEQVAEYFAREHAAEIEAAERAELLRLKEKYEP